jgi:hypothetical protein
MTSKKTVREMLLAHGFKIAEPDDPIYERLSTIFVSPISAWLEKPSKRQGQNQDSVLPLSPTVLPLDPATGASEASMQITRSKSKGKNEQSAKRKKHP